MKIRIMLSLFKLLQDKKPLLFGLCGATGCLLAAATFGELFLNWTRKPPTLVRESQTIVLLIDTSGSMKGDKLAEVKAAAKSFISRQDLSQDSFAVVGFGNEGYVSSGLTSDLSTLNQ